MTIRTTLSDGRAILARGRYVERDPGCYWGDNAYPPEPAHIDDLEAFGMPANLTLDALTEEPLELSDADEQHVTDALLDSYEHGSALNAIG